MKRIAVILTIDTDSTDEAMFIAKERARLRWPPVTDINIVEHLDFEELRRELIEHLREEHMRINTVGKFNEAIAAAHGTETMTAVQVLIHKELGKIDKLLGKLHHLA